MIPEVGDPPSVRDAARFEAPVPRTRDVGDRYGPSRSATALAAFSPFLDGHLPRFCGIGVVQHPNVVRAEKAAVQRGHPDLDAALVEFVQEEGQNIFPGTVALLVIVGVGDVPQADEVESQAPDSVGRGHEIGVSLRELLLLDFRSIRGVEALPVASEGPDDAPEAHALTIEREMTLVADGDVPAIENVRLIRIGIEPERGANRRRLSTDDRTGARNREVLECAARRMPVPAPPDNDPECLSREQVQALEFRRLRQVQRGPVRGRLVLEHDNLLPELEPHHGPVDRVPGLLVPIVAPQTHRAGERVPASPFRLEDQNRQPAIPLRLVLQAAHAVAQ